VVAVHNGTLCPAAHKRMLVGTNCGAGYDKPSGLTPGESLRHGSKTTGVPGRADPASGDADGYGGGSTVTSIDDTTR